MSPYPVRHMLLRECRGALGTFMSTLRDFEVELHGKQGALVFTPGS